jgi:hypothetical protein
MFTESRSSFAEYTQGSGGTVSCILHIDSKRRQWRASLSGHFAPEEKDSRCLLDGKTWSGCFEDEVPQRLGFGDENSQYFKLFISLQ